MLKNVLKIWRTPFGTTLEWRARGRSSLAAVQKTSESFDELNFSDPTSAFGQKTQWELLRALMVLQMCSVDLLVDNSHKLLHWCHRLGGGPLIRALLYNQFVGGASADQVRHCIRTLADERKKAMLATTMEEDIGEGGDEEVYERNCVRILECIRISSAGDCVSPMVQLKLSGLLPADLLVVLGKLYKNSHDKLEIVKKTALYISNGSTKHRTLKDALDKEQEEGLTNALNRLKRIATEAETHSVRVLVDAEYTYLNPGMSLLTLAVISIYNKKLPLFWNTYQCYLKDARKKLDEELSLILGPLDVHFGAKIVRGAYMVQERNYSRKQKTVDPVCDDYRATCKNYDSIISHLLDTVRQMGPRCEFIVASHNEESIKFAVRRMTELKIDPFGGGVRFGQLYGMGDHISNSLANSGFAVYKSIPIGDLEEVIPYLVRRAIENKSVLQGARRERDLLRKELRRRIRL